MNKDDGEMLRAPMLRCLKRMIEGFTDKLRDLNRLVEEKTGKKLDMQVVSVIQNAENDFRIKVRGIAFTGRVVEEEFQVLWWNHTCPAHFHLRQWGRVAFGPEHDFIYCGVIDARSETLAREIAIYTHHSQIPGILSR